MLGKKITARTWLVPHQALTLCPTHGPCSQTGCYHHGVARGGILREKFFVEERGEGRRRSEKRGKKQMGKQEKCVDMSNVPSLKKLPSNLMFQV